MRDGRPGARRGPFWGRGVAVVPGGLESSGGRGCRGDVPGAAVAGGVLARVSRARRESRRCKRRSRRSRRSAERGECDPRSASGSRPGCPALAARSPRAWRRAIELRRCRRDGSAAARALCASGRRVAGASQRRCVRPGRLAVTEDPSMTQQRLSTRCAPRAERSADHRGTQQITQALNLDVGASRSATASAIESTSFFASRRSVFTRSPRVSASATARQHRSHADS